MATRATYQIDDFTFYSHWDGYPSGAAARFWNMVDAMTQPETGDRSKIAALENRRGGAAFAFIRGNMDAEPTDGHDAHGDTEYRYTVKTSREEHGRLFIDVDERRGDGWQRVTIGEPLALWVNRQLRDEAFSRLVEIVEERAYSRGRHRVATGVAAAAIAERHREIAAQFKDGNPNKSVHEDLAEAWSLGGSLVPA